MGSYSSIKTYDFLLFCIKGIDWATFLFSNEIKFKFILFIDGGAGKFNKFNGGGGGKFNEPIGGGGGKFNEPIGGGGGKFIEFNGGGGGKFILLRGGGGGKSDELFIFIFWDGDDNGWLLLMLKLSIYFLEIIDSFKSSSKKRFKNFCALNYFDPNVGGSRVFLNIAWERDNYETETLSC